MCRVKKRRVFLVGLLLTLMVFVSSGTLIGSSGVSADTQVPPDAGIQPAAPIPDLEPPPDGGEANGCYIIVQLNYITICDEPEHGFAWIGDDWSFYVSARCSGGGGYEVMRIPTCGTTKLPYSGDPPEELIFHGEAKGNRYKLKINAKAHEDDTEDEYGEKTGLPWLSNGIPLGRKTQLGDDHKKVTREITLVCPREGSHTVPVTLELLVKERSVPNKQSEQEAEKQRPKDPVPRARVIMELQITISKAWPY